MSYFALRLANWPSSSQSDGARARAAPPLAPPDPREVLLVNEDGLVMEGSISTCYFWRGGRWVTPVVSAPYTEVDAATGPGGSGPDPGSGGNDGTTRRWALKRYVSPDDVVESGAHKSRRGPRKASRCICVPWKGEQLTQKEQEPRHGAERQGQLTGRRRGMLD